MMRPQTDSSATVRAEIAIHALRAALGSAAPADQIVFSPGGASHTDASAARELVNLAPARLSAVWYEDTMWITCTPLSGELLERERRHYRAFDGYLGSMGRAALERSDQTSVLLKGGGEPMVVRPEHLDGSGLDYVIDMDHSVGGREPTTDERLLDVGWVVTFSGSAPNSDRTRSANR